MQNIGPFLWKPEQVQYPEHHARVRAACEAVSAFIQKVKANPGASFTDFFKLREENEPWFDCRYIAEFVVKVGFSFSGVSFARGGTLYRFSDGLDRQLNREKRQIETLSRINVKGQAIPMNVLRCIVSFNSVEPFPDSSFILFSHSPQVKTQEEKWTEAYQASRNAAKRKFAEHKKREKERQQNEQIAQALERTKAKDEASSTKKKTKKRRKLEKD